MATTPYGPPPSRLVLLSDLPHLAIGTKVRFLGCVETYAIRPATLTLTHNQATVLAHVDIIHVLESLHSTDLQTGAWVNVIGYVTAPNSNNYNHKNDGSSSSSSTRVVGVQAIMLWAAGENLHLDAYEQAVEARKGLDGGVASVGVR